mmetsp:Transcript_28302/g.59493  ORF Transcript_28302/g.59493 Transcript_28302/m.59493 type:complete len:264 (+) Transcript_28302:1877-2668(+)
MCRLGTRSTSAETSSCLRASTRAGRRPRRSANSCSTRRRSSDALAAAPTSSPPPCTAQVRATSAARRSCRTSTPRAASHRGGRWTLSTRKSAASSSGTTSGFSSTRHRWRRGTGASHTRRPSQSLRRCSTPSKRTTRLRSPGRSWLCALHSSLSKAANGSPARWTPAALRGTWWSTWSGRSVTTKLSPEQARRIGSLSRVNRISRTSRRLLCRTATSRAKIRTSLIPPQSFAKVSSRPTRTRALFWRWRWGSMGYFPCCSVSA